MWVRSEYANELAVLSAWLAFFLPWNLANLTRTDDLLPEMPLFSGEVESSIFFFRLPFAEFQLRRPGSIRGEPVEGENLTAEIEGADASGILDSTYAGTQVVDSLYVTTPPTSMAFYDGTLWQVSLLWTLAAVAFALAFLFSLALYVREDAVTDRLPFSAVRTMGALLGLYALGVAAASWLQFTQRDVVGFPIPAGVIVIGALAVVLLRTEEVEAADTGS